MGYAIRWLIVGCFGLYLAHEEVLCVDELVLVEGVVLDCCADSVRYVLETEKGITEDEQTYSQMLPF